MCAAVGTASHQRGVELFAVCGRSGNVCKFGRPVRNLSAPDCNKHLTLCTHILRFLRFYAFLIRSWPNAPKNDVPWILLHF